MLEPASSVGLKCDPALLRLFPDATGPQHDETKSSVFRFARKKRRDPPHDAPLHPSVIERFEAQAILDYDLMRPYRPECLRKHERLAHYFDADALIAEFDDRAADQAALRATEARQRSDEKTAKHWDQVVLEIGRRSAAPSGGALQTT